MFCSALLYYFYSIFFALQCEEEEEEKVGYRCLYLGSVNMGERGDVELIENGIHTILNQSPAGLQPCAMQYMYTCTVCTVFFCLRDRFPSLTLRFSIYMMVSHNDPAALQVHCGRCRVRTWDLYPCRSLVLYLYEPPHLHHVYCVYSTEYVYDVTFIETFGQLNISKFT